MGGKEGPKSGDTGKPIFSRDPIENESPQVLQPFVRRNAIENRSPQGPHELVVMTVRLEISMPPVIRLGTRIALEVQISLQPNTPRPQGTEEVKLSIFSPGFRLLSGHVRHVRLSLKKEKSIRERFEMEAQEEGRHKIRVSVFVGGTWEGSRTIESEVAKNAETKQATSVDSTIQIGTAEKGEVTLEVFYEGAQRAYGYELNSATFKVDRVLSKPLLRSPEEIIDVFVKQLSLHARNQGSSSSQAIAAKWLRNIGIKLWQDFIPEELAQQFWKHRSEIERLTILSDVAGHMIPWEAMYPITRTGDKAGFLIDQVTVVRKSYDSSSRSTEPFHFSETCFVVPEEDDPPTAKQEVKAIESLLSGKKFEVGNVSDLLRVLEEEKFNLLHFACHNLLGGKDYPGPYILLGEGRFEPVFLGDCTGKYKQQSPLIFMNVCRSDGGSPGYTSIINWADSFLRTGAGAFIGTLWEVRDETAALFAERFYCELVSGKSLGEAMHLARAAFRGKPDDPTWLAYTLYGDPKATLSGESTPSKLCAQSEN